MSKKQKQQEIQKGVEYSQLPSVPMLKKNKSEKPQQQKEEKTNTKPLFNLKIPMSEFCDLNDAKMIKKEYEKLFDQDRKTKNLKQKQLRIIVEYMMKKSNLITYSLGNINTIKRILQEFFKSVLYVMILTKDEFGILLDQNPNQKMLSYLIALQLEDAFRNQIEDELSNIYLCLTLEIKLNANSVKDSINANKNKKIEDHPSKEREIHNYKIQKKIQERSIKIESHPCERIDCINTSEYDYVRIDFQFTKQQKQEIMYYPRTVPFGENYKQQQVNGKIENHKECVNDPSNNKQKKKDNQMFEEFTSYNIAEQEETKIPEHVKKALKQPLTTIRETFREDRVSTYAPSMADEDEMVGKYETPDFLLTDDGLNTSAIEKKAKPSNASVNMEQLLKDSSSLSESNQLFGNSGHKASVDKEIKEDDADKIVNMGESLKLVPSDMSDAQKQFFALPNFGQTFDDETKDDQIRSTGVTSDKFPSVSIDNHLEIKASQLSLPSQISMLTTAQKSQSHRGPASFESVKKWPSSLSSGENSPKQRSPVQEVESARKTDISVDTILSEGRIGKGLNDFADITKTKNKKRRGIQRADNSPARKSGVFCCAPRRK